jgi:hypothetical protein
MRYPTVNDNDDPNSINWSGFDFSELDTSVDTIVLPLNQRIEARGERLFINLCYVAFTDQIKEGKYEHDNPEEYAEFVLATYLHLKEKYGLVPDVWEVLLEPDNGQKQWNANLMGRAIVAASAKLKANGFTPAFVAPSTKDMANAAPWIEEIAKVPSAMENVAEFSYHRYRSSSAANARAIGKIGERFGKPTGMLEWWFKNGTYKVLREDLVQARNSSWQGQVIRTLFDIDFANPRAPVVTIASDTRMNLQYFRYIRLGAQRIGASSTDPRNTRPTAFVNSDGRMIVVADTKGAVTLTIRGARSGKYRVSYALDDRSVVDPEVVTPLANGDVVVRMPGRGVITVSPADASRGCRSRIESRSPRRTRGRPWAGGFTIEADQRLNSGGCAAASASRLWRSIERHSPHRPVRRSTATRDAQTRGNELGGRSTTLMRWIWPGVTPCKTVESRMRLRYSPSSGGAQFGY